MSKNLKMASVGNFTIVIHNVKFTYTICVWTNLCFRWMTPFVNYSTAGAMQAVLEWIYGQVGKSSALYS